MRKIRCAVVDDEPLAVKLIESFIGRTPFLELACSFTDSVEAMEKLRENPVDLAFLDIQMADMDGMELSHVLPRETRIIFTTAFREYAFESYEVSAIDFLLKPIRYDKFLRAAEKALQWYEMKETISPAARETSAGVPPQANEPSASPSSDIFIRVDGEIRCVKLSDILYVEGMKDYVRFFLKECQPLTTHLTMKSVEESLPTARFMRVSRSHIISLENIRAIDRNMCIYIGDTIIRVTEMYRPAFSSFLQQRLAK